MRIVIAILCLVIGHSANAQAEKPEIVRFLGQMHQLPFVREDFVESGFEGENLELAIGQMKRILTDPGISNYVADRLIEAGSGAPTPSLVTGGLIGPLFDRGMGHLTTSELKFYYNVEKEVISSMSVRNCGRTFRNKLPPHKLSLAMERGAAKLDTPVLKEFYRIQFKAAKLGLKRKAAQLSSTELEATLGNLSEQLMERISEKKNGPALMLALGNIQRANNDTACEAGLLMLNTVLEMKGRYLRSSLIYLVTG